MNNIRVIRAFTASLILVLTVALVCPIKASAWTAGNLPTCSLDMDTAGAFASGSVTINPQTHDTAGIALRPASQILVQDDQNVLHWLVSNDINGIKFVEDSGNITLVASNYGSYVVNAGTLGTATTVAGTTTYDTNTTDQFTIACVGLEHCVQNSENYTFPTWQYYSGNTDEIYACSGALVPTTTDNSGGVFAPITNGLQIIGNIITTGLQHVIDAVTGIADAIGNILKWVFIPDTAALSNKFTEMVNSFDSQFGLLVYPFELGADILTTFTQGGNSSNTVECFGQLHGPFDNNGGNGTPVCIDPSAWEQISPTGYNTILAFIRGVFCLLLAFGLYKKFDEVVKA